MLRIHRWTAALAVGLTATGCATSEARPTSSPAAAPVAAEGEAVMVIVNRVKPDKRQQFERFVRDFLVPGVEMLGETDTRARMAHRQTRVIEANAANPDGTWTYLFVMDPIVPGFSYGFDELDAVYPAAEVERQVRLFWDSLAEEQEHIRGTVAPIW